jgi:predicted transglutaminase-like cysteine proteinase
MAVVRTLARSMQPAPAWLCTSAAALALAFAIAGAGEAKAQAKAPATARVFTINELLAKHDAGRPDAAGKIAAVRRDAGTLNDATPPVRGSTGPEPFGLYAFRAPDGQLWTKWRALEAELANEMKRVEECRADMKNCTGEARRFVLIADEAKSRAGRARLEVANRLLNGAIRYVSDAQQHGTPDRWTPPLAALAAEQGDCEDYAIAKFAALREAGIPEADMRLVLVRDTKIRIDHAVLAVRFEGEWLVLDNRRAFVTDTMELKHYMPLFALDRDGVKLFAAPYANWGEPAGEFAGWTLRGSTGEVAETQTPADPALEFGAWLLRGTNAEPAAPR